MFKKMFILSFALVLCLALGVSTSLAAAGTVTGTIDGGDPSLPVVFISTPNCTGQGVSLVHYEVLPFTVDADGAYTFTLNSDAGFASLYIFAVSFDPANPFPTCIAGANNTPPVLNPVLTAGTQYFAVPFDDTFTQFGGSYSLTVSGPGNVSGITNVSCTYPLPENSVLYSVPAGAPVFYDADLNTKVNFDLPAGTWKISEFSGDFAKVWIACEAQPIWIPTNAVGGAVS